MDIESRKKLAFAQFCQRFGDGILFSNDPLPVNSRLLQTAKIIAMPLVQAMLGGLVGKTNGAGDSFNYCVGHLHGSATGAFTGLYDEICCMATTGSLKLTLQEIAIKTFRSPHIFRDLGNAPICPGNARIHISYLHWGFDWLAMLDRGKPIDDGSEYSKGLEIPCPERFVLAGYFHMLLQAFVWWHECAHIMAGHIHYLRAQNQTPSIADYIKLVSEKSDSRNRSLYHFMEYEADIIAFTILVKASIDKTLPTLGSPLLECTSVRVRLALMAAIFVIYSLLQVRPDFDTLETRSHPDYVGRIHVACLQIRDRFRSEYGAVFEDSFWLFQDDLRDLYQEHPNFVFLVNAVIPTAITEMFADDYTEIRESVLEEIEAFSRFAFTEVRRGR